MVTTFGQRLKQARIQSGKRATAIARAAGVSRQQFWKWENDIGSPDPDDVGKLAAALGCPLDELILIETGKAAS